LTLFVISFVLFEGNDTFNTFEEVLQLARLKNVDFLLLGGDLFHENKPSSKCMTKCIELLRKYCLGESEINFSIISDQKVNFNHCQFPIVNYEDANLNISLPVFSIHGNHDDPVGKDAICALDTVSATGFLNYFGKYVDMDNIVLSPILMKKANNRIALYGLGSLPEERLHRFFLQKKVNFLEPSEDSSRWFKILVIHQNRVAHGTKYLPEKLLTKLPDLVIWGHEHESITHLDFNSQQNMYIFQPGSTVITSLCPGEAAPKHVGLLEVNYNSNLEENKFKVECIPLRTARRLYFETINLDEILEQLPKSREPDKKNQVIYDLVVEKIESLLTTAEVEHSGEEKEPKEPLIRLRIDISNEYHQINSAVFGQSFMGRVANPKDMVLFKTKRASKMKSNVNLDTEKLDELMEVDDQVRCNIEDVIMEYFANAEPKSKMNLLLEKLLTEGVKEMVEKDSTADKLNTAAEYQMKKTCEALYLQEDLDIDNEKEIVSNIQQFKETLIQNEKKVLKEIAKLKEKS